MAAKILTKAGANGAANASWGASGVPSTLGKVVSCTVKTTCKNTEEPDEDGEVYAWITTDHRTEIDAEIMCHSTATAPAVGDTITIGGNTGCIVKESSTKWTAGATKKISVSAFKCA